MNVKQIVVVVAILGICGYLYHLNPKGLVKPKETRTNTGVASDKPAAANVNVATVSATAKVAVGAALSGKINDLENQLKTASGEKKLALQKQLAISWDDVNQPAPAAFYYQAVAQAENKTQNWLNAGDRFNNAFKTSQDTSVQPVFISNAVEAFQNALKLSPESLEGKTGLGVAYVNGGAMPMQGIALLLEVVKKDPRNLDANLNLGMFSMKSGQYEKAIDRFKTVIAVKPGFEPYYYLAQAYTQIGKKTEAIAAYQKCKELMPDQVFGQRIDQYIKELKN
ncbi:MAG: tetratricopeptide repeat protein [Mucilaginibacter sp.]